jgi:predicted transcriptional regulator
VLDQYTRGRIQGFITANPGAHYSNIKAMLGLQNGTLAYHLRRLEREGFVFSRRDGIYKRFFPAHYDPNGSTFSTLQEKILEKVIESPGITKKELSAILDKRPQVLDYHLRWMIRNDIMEMRKDGKRNRYYPTEQMEDGSEE